MSHVTNGDGFLGIDDEMATLLLQFQIEDLGDLIEHAYPKGKRRPGVLTEEQSGYQQLKQELEGNFRLLEDKRIARSMARAVVTDAAAITQYYEQEQVASSDRAMALRLGGGQAAPRPIFPTPASSTGGGLSMELIDKLSAIYVDNPYGDTASTINISLGPESEYGGDAPESSAMATSCQPVRSDKRECVICCEMLPYFEIARLECGHECCGDCLREMFRGSIVDEDRYPPRCCEAISPYSDETRLFLNEIILIEFEIKKIEYETENRVNCSNKTCLAFIAPNNIVGDHAFCGLCSTVTCAICKKSDHGGICPEGEDMNRTLELVRENKWQRCRTCNHGVSIHIGCNHIKCRCGSQFCYVCGSPWKTCGCPQWDERNLLLRANDLAARNDDVGGARVIADNLRAVGHCNHEAFRWTRGSGVCEGCAWEMPDFSFRCVFCLFRVCRRCRDVHQTVE